MDGLAFRVSVAGHRDDETLAHWITIRMMVGMHNRLLVVPIAMMLAGCPGMTPKDNEQFRGYVDETLSPGMPFVKAIQVLTRESFDCSDQGAAPAVECIRMRGGFMYGCIYRIHLHLDVERKKLLSATAPPISCAGI
jgi:hypothetical protein